MGLRKAAPFILISFGLTEDSFKHKVTMHYEVNEKRKKPVPMYILV